MQISQLNTKQPKNPLNNLQFTAKKKETLLYPRIHNTSVNFYRKI